MARLEDLSLFLSAGFPLIKIIPGQKAPYAGWPTEHNTTEQITTHIKNGGNVGWRLGPADVVIDVDPRNFGHNDLVFDELCEDFQLYPSRMPHCETAGGGHHYYLVKDPDIPIRETLPDYPGIEFKTYGRQVLIPPSHNATTERYYEWDDLNPSPSQRPNVPDVLLNALRKAEVSSAKVESGGLGLEEFRSWLFQADPTYYNRDHDQWLPFMIACHHATAGEGRDIFLEWCRQDPDYATDTTIGQRWDSFDVNHPSPVTIQTFYHHLKQMGVDLTPRLIQPFLDDPLPDEPDLEVDLDVEEDKETKTIRWMNGQHCVIFNGKLRIYTKSFDPIEDRHYYTSSTLKDFTDYYANRTITQYIAGKNGQMFPVDVSVGKFWFEHKGRSQYRSIAFAPNQSPKDTLNLWQGFSVEPKQGDCSLFYRLVREVLASGVEEQYEYVLNWLAYLIQYPELKAKVALVLQGEKGVGKGFFGKTIMALIRAHALQITSQDQLLGKFNTHLQSCKLLFADEAFWAGNKSFDGVLKALVTEEQMTYEEKHGLIYSGRNMLSMIIASNSDWVIPASMKDERRYMVMNVTEDWQDNQELFDAYEVQMYEQGGLEALMYDLQHRDIKKWAPWHSVPETEGLAEQIEQGLDDLQSWWYEILEKGQLPGEEDNWPSEGNHTAPTHDLYMSFLKYLELLRRHTYVMNKIHFRRKLNKLVNERIRKNQIMKKGIRSYHLVVPGLRICRENFEKQLKTQITWEPTRVIEKRGVAEDPFESTTYEDLL